jgi:quinol monooxygenase YgiN
MRMAIIVIVELPFKAESLDQFVGILRSPDGMAKTRAYEGCNRIETILHRDTNTLVFVEKWATRENHEAYLKWRTETGMMDAVGPMLAGEMRVRYFDLVDC